MSVLDKIKDDINKVAGTINNMATHSFTKEEQETKSEIIDEKITALSRQAAAEGAVLLKNDGTLPLAKGSRLSVFSRLQKDWFYVGYGSGGAVKCRNNVSLLEALRNCDELEINEELVSRYETFIEKNPIPTEFVWGNWRVSHNDIVLKSEIVEKAKMQSDAAIYIIGRGAGEDKDCTLEKGSYYLYDWELENLKTITSVFDKVIVLLNVGMIMDMSWAENFGDKISAILCVWQGGMESGNAVCDLLTGKVNPCGKLSDTIAKSYYDYPSSANFGNKIFNNYEEDIFVGYRYFETFDKNSVIYPFGFGLSYTDFEFECSAAQAVENGFSFKIKVTNVGKLSGKEVVQLYLQKPVGRLGNPARELAAFGKTKVLAPKESEEIELFVDFYQLCSYDDCGSTNHAGCYVVEKGDYKFHLGKNVRDTEEIFNYYQEENFVYSQHKQASAPQEHFDVYHAETVDGKTVLKKKPVAKQKFDMATRILNNMPKDIPQVGDVGYKLADVKEGKITLEEFTAQLSLDELEAISRGDYTVDSPLGAAGNTGVCAGVLQSLRDKGVPPIITSDGPSGLSLKANCSLIPIGLLLASSYNTGLIEELCTELAKEMKSRGADILLAPGLNIHRNPLCGRNFEYFSEDPYISGKMAAAYVKGIQSGGLSACPKHFACNNQEFKRTKNDSRLSERALREIYLKGFEICVKEAHPKNIMTSYNKINGVWGHYNYDLCTTILRNEWGYKGNVMTDWWMQKSKSPEFPIIRDQAYRVRAQVDLFMPGAPYMDPKLRTPEMKFKPDGTLLASFGKPDGITLGEMQRTAMNVLKMAMDIKL
ncbi:MAG: glycoside hydrolase family 3 C-terminal domain-containing protein [Eubacterium sp.]|nr:glycoside hydrolase family 3 C-terminal domain-containing protein [Eubacterium sp.]